MNPIIITTIDKIALAFDHLNLSIAPIVTIEFQSPRDLELWLDHLHKELLAYAENGVVVRPSANVIDKYNDVLCNFKLRSN